MISKKDRDKIYDYVKSNLSFSMAWFRRDLWEFLNTLTADDETKGTSKEDRDKIYKLIYDFLLDFRCMYTVELGTDDGLPLVDLLSPAATVKEGKAEIQYISEELGDEIYKLLTAEDEPKWKTGTVDEFFEDITAED